MIFALQHGSTTIAKHYCKTSLESHKVSAQLHLIQAAGAPGTYPEPTAGCQLHLIQSTDAPGMTTHQALATLFVSPLPSNQYKHNADTHIATII